MAGVGGATTGDFVGFKPRPDVCLILQIFRSSLRRKDTEDKCKAANINKSTKIKFEQGMYRSSKMMLSKAEELSSPLEKESLAWRRVLDFSFSRSFVLLELEILDFFWPAEVAVPGVVFCFLAEGAWEPSASIFGRGAEESLGRNSSPPSSLSSRSSICKAGKS